MYKFKTHHSEFPEMNHQLTEPLINQSNFEGGNSDCKETNDEYTKVESLCDSARSL